MWKIANHLDELTESRETKYKILGIEIEFQKMENYPVYEGLYERIHLII